MDALALLCALHADGPQTLKRLRQAGLPTLDAIVALEAERLAELLASSPTVAARFQREARHLVARLEPGLLETGLAEEDLEQADFERAPEPARAPASGALAAARPIAKPIARPAAPPASAPPPAWAAALERWRQLDALEDDQLEDDRAQDGDPLDPAAQAADGQAADGPDVEADERALEEGTFDGAADRESTAAPAAALRRTPLSCLPDAGAGVRSALERAGVRDLEDLAACDALAIAAHSGLDYTNVVRLAALARRALPGGVGANERFSPAEVPAGERAPVLPLGRPDYVLQPAPRASREMQEETAGGPFA